MRELDALLYAQSSFQVKISDRFPSLQTRVPIKERKKKKSITVTCTFPVS